MNGLINIVLNETMTEQEKVRCIKHYTDKKCELIDTLADNALTIKDENQRIDYVVSCIPILFMF